MVSEKIESDYKKKNKVFLALNKRKCTTTPKYLYVSHKCLFYII